VLDGEQAEQQRIDDQSLGVKELADIPGKEMLMITALGGYLGSYILTP
jgi:hypothetical protein